METLDIDRVCVVAGKREQAIEKCLRYFLQTEDIEVAFRDEFKSAVGLRVVKEHVPGINFHAFIVHTRRHAPNSSLISPRSSSATRAVRASPAPVFETRRISSRERDSSSIFHITSSTSSRSVGADVDPVSRGGIFNASRILSGSVTS